MMILDVIRRRPVRDDERRIDVSKAMILVAVGGTLPRRTAHPRYPRTGFQKNRTEFRRALRALPVLRA